MLALAASLASCGGGGGGDSSAGGGTGGDGGGTGQPGVTSVTVQWTAPAARDVVTAGSALTLRAGVLADGVNAADGTVVSFSAATGVSTSALTSSGVATASLTGATPGRQQVQASATVGSRTGSASQTFYLRPAPAPLRVLVPAYFYPTGAGATAWNALAASAQANPTVQMTAILNPANGIFSGPDANITRAATAFANAGGQLVGYVSSSYGTGTRSLASIQAALEMLDFPDLEPAMREPARALLRRHQAAGDTVVIVTATNEFVTRPIAQAFGVNELIAIELERDARGEPTGAIRGTPSFREGKIARVEQWLAARGLDWSRVQHSTFYSDSINDLPLLEKVHEPVATNPDARLRAIALERGWRTLNLFE